MAIAEELKVKIRAEVDKAVRNMDQYSKSAKGARTSTQKYGKSMQSLGKMLKAGVVAAGIGAAIRGLQQLARAAKELEDAFAEQEQVEARLAQTLQSTGFAAGISEQALLDMASSLQDVTKFGDEAIIGAQSLLLTFKAIGKDVFPDALETVLDMSEALGQDLKQSSIQLGKALQDPTEGLTALRRVGIQFTEEQEDQIKAMQDAGEMAEAQRLILAELESQFGGVARAAADTASGVRDQLTNAFGDLKESIGGMLSENARPFREWLTTVTTRATEAVESIRGLNKLLEGVANQEFDDQSLEELRARLADLTEESGLFRQAWENIAVGNQRDELIAALEREIDLRVASQRIAAAAAQDDRDRSGTAEVLAEMAAREAAEQERITAELAAQAAITEGRYQKGLAQMQQVIDSNRTEMERLSDQLTFFASFTWQPHQTAQLETQAQAIAILTDQYKAAQLEAARANMPLIETAENVSRLKGNLVDTPEEWERFGQTGTTAVQTVKEEAEKLAEPTFQDRVAGFVDAIKEKYEELLPAIGAAQDMLAAYSDLSANRHEREIERLEAIRDQYERGSDEYKAAQEQIDAANEKRAAKEFRREKALAIAKAAMNTAIGVTQMLATGRIGMAIAVGALGALQIGAIAAQQGPGGGGGGAAPSTAPTTVSTPEAATGQGGGGGNTYNVYYYNQNVEGSIHAERDLEEIGANGAARNMGAF
jgi:hypothetical protein